MSLWMNWNLFLHGCCSLAFNLLNTFYKILYHFNKHTFSILKACRLGKRFFGSVVRANGPREIVVSLLALGNLLAVDTRPRRCAAAVVHNTTIIINSSWRGNDTLFVSHSNPVVFKTNFENVRNYLTIWSDGSNEHYNLNYTNRRWLIRCWKIKKWRATKFRK